VQGWDFLGETRKAILDTQRKKNKKWRKQIREGKNKKLGLPCTGDGGIKQQDPLPAMALNGHEVTERQKGRRGRQKREIGGEKLDRTEGAGCGLEKKVAETGSRQRLGHLRR